MLLFLYEALDFGYDNELSMEYLYCSANLYAHVFGIEYVRDKEEFMEICKAKNFQNPEYVPKFVDNEENEEEEENNEVNFKSLFLACRLFQKTKTE
jgi:hypothetical protein